MYFIRDQIFLWINLAAHVRMPRLGIILEVLKNQTITELHPGLYESEVKHAGSKWLMLIQQQPWYLSLDDALQNPLLASEQKEPPRLLLDDRGSTMALGQPAPGHLLNSDHIPPLFQISPPLLPRPYPPLGIPEEGRFGLDETFLNCWERRNKNIALWFCCNVG